MEDSATPIPPSLWTSLNSWFTSTVFFVLLNLMIATIVFTSNLPNNTKFQQEEEDEQKQNHQPTQIARSPSVLHRLKSFNFYPQKPQPESSPDTHYHHQHQQPPPLEVAATQYVFDQPLQYQHFDFDPTNPDQFDFEPTRQDDMRRDTGFDFDPTRQDMRRNEKLDFDSTRQEIRREKQFDFDPTGNEMYTETGFGYDPTRKEMQTGAGFDFDTADEEREHTDEFQSLDEVYSKLKTGGHDRSKSESGIPAKAPVKMKKSLSLKVGFAHLEEEEIVEARRPATVRERKSAVKVVDDDDVEVDSRADDFINKFKNDLKLQRIESIIRTKEATNRGAGR